MIRCIQFKLILLLAAMFIFVAVNAQNVGINATGAVPNASAILDVSATDKGFLIPRIALTQTTSNAPIGPTIITSLLVYNTATVNDVTPGFFITGTERYGFAFNPIWILTMIGTKKPPQLHRII